MLNQVAVAQGLPSGTFKINKTWAAAIESLTVTGRTASKLAHSHEC